MKILVTGAAGFIGYHVCESLLSQGFEVYGLDNINNYYDPHLKLDRLKQLGIVSPVEYNKLHPTTKHANFHFIKLDLEDKENLFDFIKDKDITIICHLAAQAGVRYSLENPSVYVNSNVVGFLNILEACRTFNIKKLVYASSSSVYGSNEKIPFSIEDNVNHPVSLYAATKRSNELMAYTYAHLFDIQTIGLRFFTVYGPWGRPDMAMFLFTDAILNDKSIKVFNNGELSRDFTYIDDIVKGVVSTLLKEKKEKYSLYNIGNNKPVRILDFISEIEKCTNKVARKEYLPMQPGDVKETWADIDDFIKDYNYYPVTDIRTGVANFVNWYKGYYNKQ